MAVAINERASRTETAIEQEIESQPRDLSQLILAKMKGDKNPNRVWTVTQMRGALGDAGGFSGFKLIDSVMTNLAHEGWLVAVTNFDGEYEQDQRASEGRYRLNNAKKSTR